MVSRSSYYAAARNGMANTATSPLRCIFAKKEHFPSHGVGEFRNSCGCYDVINRIKGGDAYLDLLDAWHDVISPRDGVVAASNRDRHQQSSDPNRRLYNRRSRLSSVDLDSSDSLPPPTNSPPGRTVSSSWVEAPEFVPSSPPASYDVMMPPHPLSPPPHHGLNGFQSFDQFLASGYIRMQRQQQQSGNHNYRHNNPQHRLVGGWRDLPPATHVPRGNGRNHYTRKSAHAAAAAFASGDELSLNGKVNPNNLHRKACSFCIRNGGDKSMYDSHCLRNPITNAIMCPELKKLKLCHKCGDTGDDFVHTSSEHDRF